MSLIESTAEPTLLQTGTTASRAFAALDGDLTRSEQIGFWLYVAMGILCMAVVVAAAASAIVT